MFQSTRPRGARRHQLNFYQHKLSFNPRARAGRDEYSDYNVYSIKVSIHAPARGATALIEQVYRWAVFQSTRPRGARRRFPSLLRIS